MRNKNAPPNYLIQSVAAEAAMRKLRMTAPPLLVPAASLTLEQVTKFREEWDKLIADQSENAWKTIINSPPLSIPLHDEMVFHVEKPWMPFPKKIIGEGYTTIEPAQLPVNDCYVPLSSRRLAELLLEWGETVCVRWMKPASPQEAPQPIWYISPENQARLETIAATLDDDEREKFWLP